MYSLLPNKEAPRKEGPDHKEEEEEEDLGEGARYVYLFSLPPSVFNIWLYIIT